MRKSKHGGTESDHEKALREMGADIPEKKTTLPEAVIYLWEIHQDLSIPTADGLSIDSIINYTKHIGLNLGRMEIRAVIMLDMIFRRYIHGNS